ncbi:unnamed protein product [Arctogadus glacialis]
MEFDSVVWFTSGHQLTEPRSGSPAVLRAVGMELAVLLAVCCWLSPAWASTMEDAQYSDSAFNYDYESLRIGGMVFAVVLFVLGIGLIVTRKCGCSKSEKPSAPRPKALDAEAGLPSA